MSPNLLTQLQIQAEQADAAKDLHGALVRIVMEGEGCGPECSLEFHQWGIASMLRIARDALKRHPAFAHRED